MRLILLFRTNAVVYKYDELCLYASMHDYINHLFFNTQLWYSYEPAKLGYIFV